MFMHAVSRARAGVGEVLGSQISIAGSDMGSISALQMLYSSRIYGKLMRNMGQ